jgi:hypothetical protein
LRLAGGGGVIPAVVAVAVGSALLACVVYLVLTT